jgi:class 3 adenylate cyclase
LPFAFAITARIALMSEQAGGTLTFLFTDVEGSTRLLRELGDHFPAVQARQQGVLLNAFADHGGRVVDSHADSFFVAFTRPRDAVLAAVSAQQALGAERWPPAVEVRVRMGIHTGPVELTGERYVGLAVHRAARICTAGHGGQVLLSQASVTLLEDEEYALSPGIEFRDLGESQLKDFHRPVRLYQLIAPRLEAEFPPPRTVASSALPAVRASDADRERAVSALREHTATGHLTLEEFSERAERAYGARTSEELEAIGHDLPAAPPLDRRRPKRLTAALFANTVRTGRWRLPRFSVAFVFIGDADLDLRQAELEHGVTTITAIVLLGNIDLYVPEGIEVDFGGLGIFGHRREWGHDVPAIPGTPLVRIRILSLLGTADLWRVPGAWFGRPFREVIKALRGGRQGELPPPAGEDG